MSATRSYLIAIALLASCSTVSADDVVMFGRNSVKHISKNNSYMLALAPDEFLLGAATPVLTFQCFPNPPIMTLMVGFLDRSKPLLGPQRITIWSDRSPPRDIAVVGVLNGVLGIAATNGDQSSIEAVARALEALTSAERFIAYSHLFKTATIKSEHLAAARYRFRDLCKQ